ncbi:MAG: hypothetical protein ACRYFS_16145 [Janthinobacterium lividum]
MDRVFQLVDSNISGSELAATDSSIVDIAVSRKEQLMGFVLGNELLLLKYKNMTTFRVNWSNVGGISGLKLLKSPRPIDKARLQLYFAENGDNPYALQNILTLLMAGQPLDNPTQLPPLLFPKTEQQQAESIDRLFVLAQPFDIFFTFTRGSGVSRAIRYVDGGHWSHMGVLDTNKYVVEFTTGGTRRSTFSHLKSPLLDVGLYRIKDNPAQNLDYEKMQAFLEKMLISGSTYDWSVVPRSLLRKWLRKPSICPMLPSDFIRGDFLRLIGYA